MEGVLGECHMMSYDQWSMEHEWIPEGCWLSLATWGGLEGLLVVYQPTVVDVRAMYKASIQLSIFC